MWSEMGKQKINIQAKKVYCIARHRNRIAHDRNRLARDKEETASWGLA